MSPPIRSPFADRLASRFSRWCERLAVEPSIAERLVALARALAAETEAGHVCLSLPALAEQLTVSAEDLRTQLLGSGWVARPQTPGQAFFILDRADRLFFKRHFDYEHRLGVRIATALSRPVTTPSPASLALLATLFGPVETDGGQWQRLAAALALHRHLVVVSGGPGTGKTTTVAYLLAALLNDTPTLRIALAAPTGKAATRLSSAINARAESVPAAIRAGLPRQAQTVHRLLGYSPTGFRYHAGSPLPIDVLVVDEASMLDLSLATQLLEAVPAHARILLLGDRDQLEAVESGAVFAQLCQSQTLSEDMRARLSQATQVPLEAMDVPDDATDPMTDAVIRYTRTFRFRSDSGIGQLAFAVRAGNVEAAMTALSSNAGDLVWVKPTGPGLPPSLLEQLVGDYSDYFRLASAVGADPQRALDAFDRNRVLCGQREGPMGVTTLNAQIGRSLCAEAGLGAGAAWYAGRPVLVTRNDPVLGLFNGDVGVTIKDDTGRLRVWFVIADVLRSFSPAQLPAHDTAFAMTVHKSQGSEFDHATVILPRDESPLLSRELLYTAVTRVRASLRLLGSDGAVAIAVGRPGNRASGLRQRICDALGWQEPDY